VRQRAEMSRDARRMENIVSVHGGWIVRKMGL
jgi:hypothetical protein